AKQNAISFVESRLDGLRLRLGSAEWLLSVVRRHLWVVETDLGGRSKASPGHGMASPGHENGSLGRGIASLGRTNASRCRPNAPRRGAIASPGRANRSRVRRGAAGCDRAGRSDCCKTPLARAREPVHRVSSLRRGRVLRKQFSARVSTPRSFVSSALMRSPYEYK